MGFEIVSERMLMQYNNNIIISQYYITRLFALYLTAVQIPKMEFI